ncbi:alginate O-acetyltransferase AlgX-related protein [Desulfovibrio sp. TomC]|uniref:alginate O-acetyltransferase AlgX-related protein n=1 Tax=Desulfovibrio sp. TomC TaxID=1562888 RepID=UPI0005739FF6|nr:hypothetical protein [Desulfovibrio sp. TomC]KHK04277.1 alginate biosynthesis protein AlgJ [Desulfovibrio sp. TomC]
MLTMLALPTLDRVLQFAPKGMLAESDMSPLPEVTANPASWGRWFNSLRHGYLDHRYNLRSQLITWNSYMDIFVLASTMPSSKVMAGKDHWLFLAQDGAFRNVIEDARSPDDLPAVSVDILVNELDRRQKWLEARGIRYLVILTPNKNSVYPEMLPESLRPKRLYSHRDQFVKAVQSRTNVDIVDVTSALVEEKKNDKVFYMTDSHWNAHGAFAAYRRIMDHLVRDFPAITPLDHNQFQVEQYAWLPGDLAFMMGLSDYLKEDRILFFNKEWYKARGTTYEGPTDPEYFEVPQYSVTGNAKLPNAVIFHDSFWLELLPFMAESFDKALYVWLKPQTESHLRLFDAALIEREKPDLVIDEFTERYILPPLHGGFKLKNDTKAGSD